MSCLSENTAASPGLARWAQAVRTGERLDSDAFAEMIAHPRFAEACRTSLKCAVERTWRNPVLTRVTKDMGRLLYGYLVLYLDARGAITLKAIQDLFRGANLFSSGRAQALLFHLRAIGYLEHDPDNTDRRSKRYVPSPDMKNALREAIADDLRAFSLIEPAAGIAADRLAETEFFRAFMLQVGQISIESVKFRPVRMISHFADRNAGLVILWEVLLSAQEGDSFPPRGPLKMSLIALARKYAVSRAHVFRLFRGAEGLGLLSRDADAQTGTISDALAREIAEFQVIIFLGLARCAHFAFEATAERTDSAA